MGKGGFVFWLLVWTLRSSLHRVTPFLRLQIFVGDREGVAVFEFATL